MKDDTSMSSATITGDKLREKSAALGSTKAAVPKGKGKRLAIVVNERQIVGTYGSNEKNLKHIGQPQTTKDNPITTIAAEKPHRNRGGSQEIGQQSHSEDPLPCNRAAESDEHTLVQGGKTGDPVSRRISSTCVTANSNHSGIDGTFSEHQSDTPIVEPVSTDSCMEDVSFDQ